MPVRRGLCSGSGSTGILPVRAALWLLIAIAVWLLLASLNPGPVFAADRVASVEYSKGAVSAVDTDGNPRLLGRGSDLFTGDLIATASQSFAIVKFDDGTLMTLRPDTEFRVDNFKPERGSGQALFKLLKGGFRVLTGFISKSSDGIFRVDTPVATIGVRGTEFDARLCASDACAEGDLTDTTPVNAIGAIVELEGTVSISNGGSDRSGAIGLTVEAGSAVRTAASSWALLVFRDGSRLTVEPDSLLQLEQFNHDAVQSSESRFVMRLERGRLRAMTGAIAQLNPAAYRIETASSTIGVRGAGFVDVAADATVALNVWDNCVDFSSATGTLPVCADQQATQEAPDAVPQLSVSMPASLRNLSGPRPDQVDQSEFDRQLQALAVVEPRLYVSVTEGRVDVANDGSSVVLGPSQNAVALPEGEIQLIEDIPDTMRNDAMPKPGDVNDRLLGLFDLVQGGLTRDANARATARTSSDDSGQSAAGSSDESSENAVETGSGEQASDEVVAVEDSGTQSSTEPNEDLIPLECAVQ